MFETDAEIQEFNKALFAGQKPILQVIMERDHLSKTEARACILDCKEDLENLEEDGIYMDVDECIACHLGLEPDYLFEILDFG